MTAEYTPERRRTPRAVLHPSTECRLEMRTRVRLVDISLTGALLASDAPLPIGARAQLRTTVTASSFTPAVQINRIADATGQAAGCALGAVFTAIDERSRRSLEEFLRKASL